MGSISLADDVVDGRPDLVVAGRSTAEDDAIPSSSHVSGFFPFCAFFSLFGAIFLHDGEGPELLNWIGFELLDWGGRGLFNRKNSNRLPGKDLNLLFRKELGEMFDKEYLKLLDERGLQL